MNLWRLFERSVRLYSSKTALIYGNRRVTFDELHRLSCQAAWRLSREADGKKQQKVWLLAKNSVELVALMLGCFRSGLVACPINWRLSAKELAVLLQEESYVVFASGREQQPLLASAMKLTGITGKAVYDLEELVQETGSKAGDFDSEEDKLPLCGGQPGPEDIAIQLFTSGSTGTPKPVWHTHGGLISYIYVYGMESRWMGSDVYQTSANLFHLSGLSVITSLMIGSTTVLFSKFDLDEFLAAIEREKSTRVSFIPTLITRLLYDERVKHYTLSSVRKIIYGGSPMNYATVVQAMERFHCQLEQAYGATESCCMALLLPEEHLDCARGSCDAKVLGSAGKPLPTVEMRISPHDAYWEKGVLYGEVEVKSPFLGQMKAGSLTEDGYYPTGDIGWFDKNGYLYLVSRKHDMIISGGENIYPKEVEDCIASLKEDVRQVCVLGMPDPYWGECVVACIVRNPGSGLTKEQVTAYCREHIASYKKPRWVEFMDALPENANGKVSRELLREKLLLKRAGKRKTGVNS